LRQSLSPHRHSAYDREDFLTKTILEAKRQIEEELSRS
jgi:hypothetical protein